MLDWFRKPRLPGDGIMARPTRLIATDVAAEGLDLPLLQRVIHYDLPWTAVRLEQRSGRALRLGSSAKQVEVIRLLPSKLLAATLRREAILAAKAGLPSQFGLGSADAAPWRLRARIAARWREIPAASGAVGVTRGCGAGAVVGFRLVLTDGNVREVVRARTAEGWTDATTSVAGLLEAAHGVKQSESPAAGVVRALGRALAARVRVARRRTHAARRFGRAPSIPARRALRRILALAREAARNRQREQLGLLERGLCLLRRGHTAGEAGSIQRWPDLPLPALLTLLRRLPAEPDPPEVTRVELIGMLLVEPPPAGR